MSKKRKALAVLNLKGIPYSIRPTAHSEQRMQERQVTKEDVTETIEKLKPEQIKQLQATGEKAIIINRKIKTSLVIGFLKNKIKIVTVLNREDIRNQRGTQVINI